MQKKKKKVKNRYNIMKTKSKVVDFHTDISIITLNINGLKTPIKKQKYSALKVD